MISLQDLEDWAEYTNMTTNEERIAFAADHKKIMPSRFSKWDPNNLLFTMTINPDTLHPRLMHNYTGKYLDMISDEDFMMNYEFFHDFDYYYRQAKRYPEENIWELKQMKKILDEEIAKKEALGKEALEPYEIAKYPVGNKSIRTHEIPVPFDVKRVLINFI